MKNIDLTKVSTDIISNIDSHIKAAKEQCEYLEVVKQKIQKEVQNKFRPQMDGFLRNVRPHFFVDYHKVNYKFIPILTSSGDNIVVKITISKVGIMPKGIDVSYIETIADSKQSKFILKQTLFPQHHKLKGIAESKDLRFKFSVIEKLVISMYFNRKEQNSAFKSNHALTEAIKSVLNS